MNNPINLKEPKIVKDFMIESLSLYHLTFKNNRIFVMLQDFLTELELNQRLIIDSYDALFKRLSLISRQKLIGVSHRNMYILNED